MIEYRFSGCLDTIGRHSHEDFERRVLNSKKKKKRKKWREDECIGIEIGYKIDPIKPRSRSLRSRRIFFRLPFFFPLDPSQARVDAEKKRDRVVPRRSSL